MSTNSNFSDFSTVAVVAFPKPEAMPGNPYTTKCSQKELFFQKYSSLKPVLNQLKKEVKTDFILIYGSYARFQATKESDIDLLVVGTIRDKRKIQEIIISLDTHVSIKIESLAIFRKRSSDALHQQILKVGIVIYDKGKYFEEFLFSSQDTINLQ